MTECPTVELFHPRGPRVILPANLQPDVYPQILLSVSAALDAGWLAAAPGLEPGEQKATIGWIVRETAEDGIRIQMYRPDDRHGFIATYLNTEEQIADFEYASGLSIARLPEHVGPGHIERMKDQRLDKLVIAPPRPFQIVWKPNPKFEEGAKEWSKRKRVFVRWDAQRTTAAPPSDAPANGAHVNSHQPASSPNRTTANGTPPATPLATPGDERSLKPDQLAMIRTLLAENQITEPQFAGFAGVDPLTRMPMIYAECVRLLLVTKAHPARFLDFMAKRLNRPINALVDIQPAELAIAETALRAKKTQQEGAAA